MMVILQKKFHRCNSGEDFSPSVYVYTKIMQKMGRNHFLPIMFAIRISNFN